MWNGDLVYCGNRTPHNPGWLFLTGGPLLRTTTPLLWCLAVLLIGPRARASEPFEIAATIARLQRIEVQDEARVPDEARPLLATLKAQIRELAGRELRSAPYASPERLQANLLRAVSMESSGLYGDVYGIEVRRPAGHEGLLAVQVTLGIPCGSDSSLYLFERREVSWRLALALESNGYEEIDGALGRFGFGVSPPARDGSFFVVAADVNPWCTSNWQRLRWRAYRLGGDPLRPQPFFEGESGIYLGTESGFELEVAEDGFRLAFTGRQDLDAGLLIRDMIQAFQVSGTEVKRVPPLAAEPRGFLDEWISLPWSDARRWTSRRVNAAEIWHGRLQERLRGLYSFFESFEVCGKDGSRWQIGLEIEPDPALHPLPIRLFFTVSQEKDDFRIERIDVRPLEGCVDAPPS